MSEVAEDGELTEPEDEIGDELVACHTCPRRERVRVGTKRRPDRFEHDEHARRADVGVDPASPA